MDCVSKNCGITLSGRNYVSVAAATIAYTAQLTAVSVGQVESKDVPCSDD